VLQCCLLSVLSSLALPLLFGLYPVLVAADRPEEVRPKDLAVKNIFLCLPNLRLHTAKRQHLISIRANQPRVASHEGALVLFYFLALSTTRKKTLVNALHKDIRIHDA
jgi:hypothetical protein